MQECCLAVGGKSKKSDGQQKRLHPDQGLEIGELRLENEDRRVESSEVGLERALVGPGL